MLDTLYSFSKEYNLQIFITTHSMTLLELVAAKVIQHPEEFSLNYLVDRYHPKLLSEPTFNNIKADMYLEGMVTPPPVKVYFEDEIGEAVHLLLIDAAKELDLDITRIPTKLIALKGGKDFLKTVWKRDDYFKTILIILDGDAKITSKEQQKEPIDMAKYIINDYRPASGQNDAKLEFNFLTLPGYLAPESFIYRILQRYSLVDTPSADLVAEASDFWAFVEERCGYTGITSQYVHQNFSVGKTKGITNDDVKAALPMNKILPFMKDANVLAFYYGYSDTRKAQLNKYIKKFNQQVAAQSKAMAARKF